MTGKWEDCCSVIQSWDREGEGTQDSSITLGSEPVTWELNSQWNKSLLCNYGMHHRSSKCPRYDPCTLKALVQLTHHSHSITSSTDWISSIILCFLNLLKPLHFGLMPILGSSTVKIKILKKKKKQNGCKNVQNEKKSFTIGLYRMVMFLIGIWSDVGTSVLPV